MYLSRSRNGLKSRDVLSKVLLTLNDRQQTVGKISSRGRLNQQQVWVQREVTHPDPVENVPVDSGLSDYLYACILTTGRAGC